MATLAICGFETGDSSEGTGAGTHSIQGTTTRGAWSAYALKVNPTTTGTGSFAITGRDGSGTSTNWMAAVAFIRFYFRVDTLPASKQEEFLVVLTGISQLGALWVNDAGNIEAYDSTGTKKATGTAVLSTATWYRIECSIDTGAGTIEWLVDGTMDGSSPGTFPGTVDSAVFGKKTDRNGKTVVYYYDDIRIDDTAYPGEGRVTCLLPNANGANQTWTIGAGAGSHYQNVNERPPDGNTTYLLSPASLNNTETEALTNTVTVGVGGTINCVMACVIAKQNVAGGTFGVALKSGAATDVGTDATVGASYVLYGRLYDTDPNTSAAWIITAVDGIETGAVDTDATNRVRMTWTGAMVDYSPSTAAAARVSTPFVVTAHLTEANSGSFFVTPSLLLAAIAQPAAVTDHGLRELGRDPNASARTRRFEQLLSRTNLWANGDFIVVNGKLAVNPSSPTIKAMLGAMPGTTTGGNAKPGEVGEYIESFAPGPTAITGSIQTITSIYLTAGDWDVTGVGIFTINGTCGSHAVGSFDMPVLFGPNGSYTRGVNMGKMTGDAAHIPIPVCRYSLSAPTTIYLNAKVDLSVGTGLARGTIRARRVR